MEIVFIALFAILIPIVTINPGKNLAAHKSAAHLVTSNSGFV